VRPQRRLRDRLLVASGLRAPGHAREIRVIRDHRMLRRDLRQQRVAALEVARVERRARGAERGAGSRGPRR
jgi:hypothetical protein